MDRSIRTLRNFAKYLHWLGLGSGMDFRFLLPCVPCCHGSLVGHSSPLVLVETRRKADRHKGLHNWHHRSTVLPRTHPQVELLPLTHPIDSQRCMTMTHSTARDAYLHLCCLLQRGPWRQELLLIHPRLAGQWDFPLRYLLIGHLRHGLAKVTCLQSTPFLQEHCPMLWRPFCPVIHQPLYPIHDNLLRLAAFQKDRHQ